MQSLKLALFSLAAFASGFWIADMIGSQDVSEASALIGRIIAVVLGIFAAGAIQMIWGSAADFADFKKRISKSDSKKDRK